jgi:transposase
MTNTKKTSPGRHAKFTDAFKAEAVRLVRTNSGRCVQSLMILALGSRRLANG